MYSAHVLKTGDDNSDPKQMSRYQTIWYNFLAYDTLQIWKIGKLPINNNIHRQQQNFSGNPFYHFFIYISIIDAIDHAETKCKNVSLYQSSVRVVSRKSIFRFREDAFFSM